MKIFLLFLLNIIFELIFALFLNLFTYNKVLNADLVFRSWLMIMIFIVPIFIYLSFFCIVVTNQWLHKYKVSICYFICMLTTLLITQYWWTREITFNPKFLFHPTHGIFERLFIFSILISLGSYFYFKHKFTVKTSSV